MTITNHLFHRSTSDHHRVSNTHCVPQSHAGRKGPNRAIEIVGRGGHVLSPDASDLSTTHPREGEFPFDVLINRLIQEQHAEIRRELLWLQELSARATKQQKNAPGKMRAVAQLVGSLIAALVAHINEEEKIFPSLLSLEVAYVGGGPAPSHRKLAREALHAFSKDHDHYLKDLQDIIRRVDSITAPADMIPVENDLSARLKTLHRLLLKHCYFETNVVFARAAAMEAELFR